MTPELVLQPRVMVIEDDPDVADILMQVITDAGMSTALAYTGREAIALKPRFQPDVVLVDLHLPDTSGATLVQWLAGENDCGIIIVSGNTEDTERIVALELGADDYIAKPPQMRELIARIRAVHRRVGRVTQAAPEPTSPRSVVMVGRLKVDLRRRAVTNEHNQVLPLTGAEFAALQLLIQARGQPVSREELSEGALRRTWRAEDRSTDQLVFSLRRKIGDENSDVRLIQSVRGAGYVLASTG